MTAAARSVDCPRASCLALAGSKCLSPARRRVNEVHVERFHAFIRKGRADRALARQHAAVAARFEGARAA